MENNMKERLTNLYKEIEFLLNQAPEENVCTDKENEMYADMTNLYNSMKNAGYGS